MHTQLVREHRSVTAPPDRLGTHDGRSLLLGNNQQIRQRCFELRRLHVIGIPTKRLVAPCRIHRIRPRAASSAERLEPRVCHAMLLQRILESVLTKMRVLARAGKAAHISDALDVVAPQHLEKLIESTSRVTNSPKRVCHAVFGATSGPASGTQFSYSQYVCATAVQRAGPRESHR